MGIRTAPNTLDPRQAGDEVSQRVSELIFSPLFILGPDLKPQPHLALRLDNPDPLTYVAHLRHGVRFHDGHELTAADVVYTFGAFLDPAYVSPFKGAFSALQSVTALDDYTVEFRLKTPFAAFPSQLVLQPPVVPAGSGDALRTFPIGTGPYRFVEYAADDHVTLSAFEGYFDGLPNNAGLVLKVVPDDTMRGLELRRGSLDVVVNDLPPDIVHQLRREETLQSTTSPGLDFSYVGINFRDPVLADRRVRQALGYAIDRQAIVEHLRRGLARLATGLVPSQAWAYEPDVDQFTYDPAKAQALLEEAGYRDPDGSRAAAPPAAVADLFDQRGDAAPVGHHPGELEAGRHRSRGAIVRVRHLLPGRAAGPIPAVQPAVGGRRAGRSRHPAPRLPLVANSAGRLQPRLLQQPGGGSRAGCRGRSHVGGGAAAVVQRGAAARRA